MSIAPQRSLSLAVLLTLGLAAPRLRAETLSVGPGKAYEKPCAAAAAAKDNDVIEIDAAGNYGGDVCAIARNGLTLRGVGGRPKIDAQGKSSGGKAIWVITGNDTTVENLEFSGCSVPDKNGAGIRQEGNNLTVRTSYFHDNDDGVLTGASAQSQITIEFSEFANNGFGDGQSHNMYIGNVARFTLRYSYSHDAKVGHLVKSRAAENFILYNRLSGEEGSSSYELDLPNAGTSFVMGNIFQQGASTENPSILAYGMEGPAAGQALYVVNNTFANDRPNGGTFVNIAAAVSTPALLQNNIFHGPGTLTNQATAVTKSNFTGDDPKFFAGELLDYTLQPSSPCINQGTSAESSSSVFALTPEWQYLHPAAARGRINIGKVDIGAYEFGDLNLPGPGGAGGAAGSAGAATAGAGTPGTGGTTTAQGGQANASAGVGAAPASGGSTEASEAACGCRTAGQGPSDWGTLCVASIATALLSRRKRRQVSSS